MRRFGTAVRFAYPGQFDRLIAIESAGRAENDALLRLAALGVQILEDAERLCQRLRLAGAECERLASAAAALAKLRGICAPPPPDDLRALLFGAKRRAARDALVLAQAESGASADDPAFLRAHRLLAEAPEPELPITGNDLIARGVEKGPQSRGNSSLVAPALG